MKTIFKQLPLCIKLPQQEADSYTLSRIAYQIAKYYFDRKQWQSSLEYLKDVYENLSIEHSHHALLLTGAALQKLKQHRQSIKFYQRVPKDSPYYAHAKLNIAVAYFRQGWWTDASIAINEAVKNQATIKDKEMLNRLHLVLGYLLLHKEYYRDARESFRNIELNSLYANRALIGLGLSAASEQDFVGALNALIVLKQKNSDDLSGDETYVLLPYVYEKLNQSMTASASYNECMLYLQKKISAIEQLLGNKHYRSLATHSLASSASSPIGPPEYILNNIKNLTRFKSLELNNKKLNRQIELLLGKHVQFYDRTVNAQLKQQQKYLHSYLNQCRFGLAKLFDKNETEN